MVAAAGPRAISAGDRRPKGRASAVRARQALDPQRDGVGAGRAAAPVPARIAALRRVIVRTAASGRWPFLPSARRTVAATPGRIGVAAAVAVAAAIAARLA